MNVMLLLALLGSMAVAGEFLLRLFPESTIRDSTPADRWKIRVLVALLVFVFLPIIDAYNLGQVQTLLNFMLMAAALLWLRGSRVSPAILLGLTCWLKPQMILFVLWGLLRAPVEIHDQPCAHVALRSRSFRSASLAGTTPWNTSRYCDTWASAATPCSGINPSTDCCIA